MPCFTWDIVRALRHYPKAIRITPANIVLRMSTAEMAATALHAFTNY
jgi:hypothetical protein